MTIMHIPAALTMTSRTLAAFYAQTYSPEKSGEWVKAQVREAA